MGLLVFAWLAPEGVYAIETANLDQYGATKVLGQLNLFFYQYWPKQERYRRKKLLANRFIELPVADLPVEHWTLEECLAFFQANRPAVLPATLPPHTRFPQGRYQMRGPGVLLSCAGQWRFVLKDRIYAASLWHDEHATLAMIKVWILPPRPLVCSTYYCSPVVIGADEIAQVSSSRVTRVYQLWEDLVREPQAGLALLLLCQS